MEGIVGLIVLAISVIGWVANAINEQKARPKGQQPGGGRARPQRRLQDEIESFLKEVQQQQGGQQNKEQTAPPRHVEEERPKPLRERERRPVAQEPKRRPPKPTRKQRRRTETPQASRRSAEPERRPITAPPGGGPSLTSPSRQDGASNQQVEQYLKTQMQQGPSRELQELLTPEQLSALRKMARNQSVAAGGLPVAQMLSGENARNAFIINEILQRPRSLR